jgi:CIC family chloride channel protein
MFMETRHAILVTLPLGALTGVLVALVLKILIPMGAMVLGLVGRMGLVLLLPAIGLFLVTAFLSVTGINGFSPLEDMDLARTEPALVFPFWHSMGKALAALLTLAFGGSVGIDGPGLWFGGALGIQYHRLLHLLTPKGKAFGRWTCHPLPLARGGVAAALAALFRAPLSGALMATERKGRIAPETLIPCLAAAVSGYAAFSLIMGQAPLLPCPNLVHLALTPKAMTSILLLGLGCGMAAVVYRWVKTKLENLLAPIPLFWRGLAAGVGLALLALPSHFLWQGIDVTQGGGMALIRELLQGHAIPRDASMFLALKLAATALTFAGGGLGGLWVPALAMGAALGATVDGLLGIGQPGYLVLTGASAMAGGFFRTLLLPVVFLAETTGQVGLIVPALLGTTISYLVTRGVE